MTNRIYYGRRSDGRVQVLTFGPFPEPLRHVVKHSPTGLEWGYAGSGPADLALSILTDHFREDPEAVLESLRSMWAPRTKAAALHQDFKARFIARLGPVWMIRGREIDEWLDEPAPAAELADVVRRNAELEAIRELEAEEVSE